MDSIEYYNKYAAKVYEDTAGDDLAEMIQAFLATLEEGATILDLGCGSGRDSLKFHELGYDVTPLDGSEEMCKLAEIHTGLDVLQIRYEEMEFDEVFDGVWACAALVHLPKDQIMAVMDRIGKSLKPEGTLYLSLRAGDFEGFQGERYFSYYTARELEKLAEQSGLFEVIDIWQTQTLQGKAADHQWLNMLVKKK